MRHLPRAAGHADGGFLAKSAAARRRARHDGGKRNLPPAGGAAQRASLRRARPVDEILVVAEKPSVARDIARVLGASARGEGMPDGRRVRGHVGHRASGGAQGAGGAGCALQALARGGPAHLARAHAAQGAAQDARTVCRGQKTHEQPGDSLHYLRDGLRTRGRADLPLHL